MIFILFIAFIFVFICVSGFISGSETAITGVSRAKLYHLAKSGNKRAVCVQKLQEKLPNSISTILVANHIVNYVISYVTATFVGAFCDGINVVIIPVVVGALLAIYAEVLPKMLAIYNSCAFSLLVGHTIEKLIKILNPLVTVLELCAKATLRIFGILIDAEDQNEQSDEELRGAIELHAPKGDAEETQKNLMLKSILDLDAITVNHVMIHRKNLVTLNVQLPMTELLEKLTKCPYSRIPLWKDNPENIVGILHTKTFFRAIQGYNGSINKINIMSLTSAPWFIPETTCLLNQLQDFRKRREHFAIVVDEYGDLMGSVTLEDILEEIVGEIVDEYDITDTSGIKQQSDGSVIADGSTSVRDLNKQFEWSLPDDEASTIAGLIMNEVHKIPEAGQVYVMYNFRIEILRRQRNQISLVKIEKIQGPITV